MINLFAYLGVLVIIIAGWYLRITGEITQGDSGIIVMLALIWQQLVGINYRR